MAEYRPIADCFERSDAIRAKHLLWADLQQERTDIAESGQYKMAFYMWLDRNELGAAVGKDEEGNLGYGLKFIPK